MKESSSKKFSTPGRGLIRVINAALAFYYLSVAAVVFQLIQNGLVGPYAFFFLLVPYGLVLILLLGPMGERVRKYLILFNLYLGAELLLLMVYGLSWVSPTTIFIHMMSVVYLNHPKLREVVQGVRTTRRILIVDDDRSVHMTLTPVLAGAGFEIHSAYSGEEGLRMARSFQPRIVILDVIMPKMKGREVCLQLKNNPQTKNIPVIFMTSKDSPDDVQAELHAGAVGHLTKPVNPKRLLGEIRKVLEGAG